MERDDAYRIMEALLFITDQPVPLKSFEVLFEKQFKLEELQEMAESLAAAYAERSSALELREIAGGWQFATRHEFGPWIRKLFKDRLTYRLSNSAMETLSIIAYKQPITRGEMEEIRGVEVSAVLDTLCERRLVKIAGRKETIGRPLLYATTPDFLKAFGLKDLSELPSIEALPMPADPEERSLQQEELELQSSGEPAAVASTAQTEAPAAEIAETPLES